MRLTTTITAAVLLVGCRTTAATIEPPADSPASVSAPASPLPEVGAALREAADDGERGTGGRKPGHGGHHGHSTADASREAGGGHAH